VEYKQKYGVVIHCRKLHVILKRNFQIMPRTA
jgi:hypothetical protein